ncbi:MAG: hypothetical protein H0W73_19915, partial [Bacteroidetes bacterium]|nr:hypothetical protein [Bacteroidota bacterium]
MRNLLFLNNKRTVFGLCLLIVLCTLGCRKIFPLKFIENQITDDINGWLIKPVKTSSRAILILPGASGYDERYKDLAMYFVDREWNVLILDYYQNGKNIKRQSAISSNKKDYSESAASNEQWDFNTILSETIDIIGFYYVSCFV